MDWEYRESDRPVGRSLHLQQKMKWKKVCDLRLIVSSSGFPFFHFAAEGRERGREGKQIPSYWTLTSPPASSRTRSSTTHLRAPALHSMGIVFRLSGKEIAAWLLKEAYSLIVGCQSLASPACLQVFSKEVAVMQSIWREGLYQQIGRWRLWSCCTWRNRGRK